MNKKNLINSWDEIHTIIQEAAEKRDRSVAIYISGDGGMSVNVHPWPDLEDLYDMYQQGKITFDDFRTKAGLPMMREEEFISSKIRFNIGAVIKNDD